MTDKTTSAADNLGAKANTDAIPQSNPSILSSAGAIGKQFNADGNIGQIPQAIGGPLSKDGAIGSQFDASKDGIAGHVERAVDGPSNPAGIFVPEMERVMGWVPIKAPQTVLNMAGRTLFNHPLSAGSLGQG
ncbi:hypothetical protein VTL71DRAFT_2457 [Oculimacula yallundae]|uniref:Uncharacterized protein n=1 Tax=Oculimacula yallundae TaxID=86028 RepID=A0ABR4C8Z3_9HELO